VRGIPILPNRQCCSKGSAMAKPMFSVRAWLDTVVLGALELALRADHTASGERAWGPGWRMHQDQRARHARGVPIRCCPGGRKSVELCRVRVSTAELEGMLSWFVLIHVIDFYIQHSAEHLWNTRGETPLTSEPTSWRGLVCEIMTTFLTDNVHVQAPTKGCSSNLPDSLLLSIL
jgi:hypothetical protein